MSGERPYSAEYYLRRWNEEINAKQLLMSECDELLAAAIEARDELSQYTAPWMEDLAAKLDEAIRKAEGS